MRILKELADLAYLTIAKKRTYPNDIYSIENSRKDLVLSLLKYPDKIFLDVGCGEGAYIKDMHPYYRLLIGIDFCKFHLLDIKNELRCAKNVELIMADAHNLPLIKNSVDMVLCSEVLEHVKVPQRVINQMSEISRKFILITVPIEAYKKTEDIVDLAGTNMDALKRSLQKIFKKQKVTHLRNFSFRSFKNMLESDKHLKIVESRSAAFTFFGSGSLRRTVAKWNLIKQLWKFIETKILSHLLIFRANFSIVGAEFGVFLLKKLNDKER